jgi:acyl-coenzyme A thioesterase PaaI-like protein
MPLHVRHAVSHLSKMDDIEAAKAKLSQFPGCAKLLAEPRLKIARPRAYRDGERQGREDSLTASTLRTGDAIPDLIYFYGEPDDDKAAVHELGALIVVGDGMNGFPGTLHGGMVATLLDEVMGIWINVNWPRGVLARTAWMTASLKMTFVKPVGTPLTVLAFARFVKLEGRKLFLDSRLENGKGEVLAKAEGLFVGLKERL